MLISSGRAPSSLTLDLLKSKGVVKPGDSHLPYNSSHSVTVPGAAAVWCDTVEQFGSGKVMCVCTVIHNTCWLTLKSRFFLSLVHP